MPFLNQFLHSGWWAVLGCSHRTQRWESVDCQRGFIQSTTSFCQHNCPETAICCSGFKCKRPRSSIRYVDFQNKVVFQETLQILDLEYVLVTGGHTIGIGHCTTISDRLYNFTGKGDTDPSLDPRYAAQLKKKCKPGNSNTVAEMDPGSFKSFDEDYYTVVAKRRGLFQSDAALLDDAETRDYVKRQSRTQGSTFAQDFAESMVKMGNIGVLTGKQGEIRKRCAFVN